MQQGVLNEHSTCHTICCVIERKQRSTLYAVWLRSLNTSTLALCAFWTINWPLWVIQAIRPFVCPSSCHHSCPSKLEAQPASQLLSRLAHTSCLQQFIRQASNSSALLKPCIHVLGIRTGKWQRLNTIKHCPLIKDRPHERFVLRQAIRTRFKDEHLHRVTPGDINCPFDACMAFAIPIHDHRQPQHMSHGVWPHCRQSAQGAGPLQYIIEGGAAPVDWH